MQPSRHRNVSLTALEGDDREQDQAGPWGGWTASEGEPDDEARFRAAFERHYSAVLGYALRRTLTPEDAEEVTASTFAIAWRRIDRLPPYTRTWLYRVVWRTLANKRRTDDRQARLLDRMHRLRVAPSVTSDEDEIGDDGGQLLEALNRLREQDQEVLRLVAWEDLTYAEASVVLGCSPNAFAVRLHRARVALKHELALIEQSSAVRARLRSQRAGRAERLGADGAHVSTSHVSSQHVSSSGDQPPIGSDRPAAAHE
jgi:RNA polymerase sigma-70 factor (ECF subfamily)